MSVNEFIDSFGNISLLILSDEFLQSHYIQFTTTYFEFISQNISRLEYWIRK